ncbi:hypothetical protein FA10DRAFT_173851 [Acaromyces ingoldii]|uniref:Uncharacterized protein n=1 Tax=Acaromyces ingoldii TaxID=215250 RepID=A0A316YEK2_9BASI|nr:hypothetical protein FA10DRAFT_173851 [Acaromyces ingoldii]PWN87649.1 hypothetical protein FA10DRAFT_173851 [Acaromyces ingoldii]
MDPSLDHDILTATSTAVMMPAFRFKNLSALLALFISNGLAVGAPILDGRAKTTESLAQGKLGWSTPVKVTVLYDQGRTALSYCKAHSYLPTSWWYTVDDYGSATVMPDLTDAQGKFVFFQVCKSMKGKIQ